LPDAALQAQFVGSCGPEAFAEATTFCAKLSSAARKYGSALGADTRVLDFGVGWGRLYRVLLNHADPGNLVGVDIDQMCIDLCSAAMPYGAFARNGVGPPLGFPDGHFDVVYAYSVFSHLAPQVARAWFEDFRRVLRPGGLVLFTTLKAAHLNVWRRQAAESESHYSACLRRAGFDYDAWRKRAARGEPLYLPIGGDDSRDVSASTGVGSYLQGSVLTVDWRISSAPAAGGQFGVWVRSAGGDWFIAETMEASGETDNTTDLTLDVPLGSGYQAIVAYRPADAGAWESFATSLRSFAVTAPSHADVAPECAPGGVSLYLPIDGDECRAASFYGETIIAKPAVRALARATGLDVRVFEDGGDLPQSFVVLQRPLG